jgi:hypothetical protein
MVALCNSAPSTAEVGVHLKSHIDNADIGAINRLSSTLGKLSTKVAARLPIRTCNNEIS